MKALLNLVKPTFKILLKARIADEAAKAQTGVFARLKLTDEQIDGVLGWVNAQIDKL